MSNPFMTLKNLTEQFNNFLKNVENEVSTDEVEQVNNLLKKYDIVLKDDNKNDLIFKYVTFYDQLNDFVLTKRKEIVDIEETLNKFSSFLINNIFLTILNKKIDNVNKILTCINRIIERIKELETSIYNEIMKS